MLSVIAVSRCNESKPSAKPNAQGCEIFEFIHQERPVDNNRPLRETLVREIATQSTNTGRTVMEGDDFSAINRALIKLQTPTTPATAVKAGGTSSSPGSARK